MAKQPLINVTCQVGGVDISGDTNSLEVSGKGSPEVTTNFASAGWQEVIGGILSADWKFKGFWEAVAVTGEPDQGFFSSLGVLVPVAYSMTRPQAQGDVAYFMATQGMTYAGHEVVGKVRSFDLDMMGNGVQARGQVLDAATRTVTGAGAGIALPAVAAGQVLYAQIQVLTVAGTAAPSILPIVQSDTTLGFGAPTTRVTFPTFTAYGASHLTIPGPITDTKYRLSFTITGTNPSFTYAVYLGIR